MFITVTLNPSIDNSYVFDTFTPGQSNRPVDTATALGGSGFNAARVALQLLTPDVTVHGFISSAAFDLASHLTATQADEQLQNRLITVAGKTRQIISLSETSQPGVQTRIHEPGTLIDDGQRRLTLLIHNIVQQLKQETRGNRPNVVALCGTLPPGLPLDSYVQCINAFRQADPAITIILDTSGDTLDYTLKHGPAPDWLTPTLTELEELVHARLDTVTALLDIVTELPFLKDIPNLIITNGAKPTYYYMHQNLFKIQPPAVTPVNTAGSGDAMVGALGYLLTKPDYDEKTQLSELIKLTTAVGTQNVMNARTGFIQPAALPPLIKLVNIRQ